MTLRSRESVTPSAVWPSPITAQQAAAGTDAAAATSSSSDGDAYWIEGRPLERGRCVIVREHDGVITDLIEAPYSARTWVHEYGGGGDARSRRGPCTSPTRATGASTRSSRTARPSR